MDVLPWQQEVWQRLAAQRARDRLPHALLLWGPPGIGKLRLATALAQAVLCAAPRDTGAACGTCRPCVLFQAHTAPDFHNIAPAEEKSVIAVDQVRELIHFMSMKSHQGGYKVAVLAPAEAMNINAANSLLKTLEEPTPHTVLILVSARPAQLTATVRSRCQAIALGVPTPEHAAAWLAGQLPPEQRAQVDALLAIANGAPLAALALAAGDALAQRRDLFSALQGMTQRAELPFAVAEAWGSRGVRQAVAWMQSWVMDLIRLKSVATPPRLANPDLAADLQVMAERLHLAGLYQQLNALTEADRLADKPVNSQLLMEELLIGWARLLRPATSR